LNDTDIQYVCSLVEEAGRLAVVMREGVEINLKSGPEDKVTAADIALSKLICGGLSQRFTADCVVSEEDKEHLFDQGSERVWVIDPIDGTQNYILDDGQYCVMVGLIVDCQPCFGWVYAPSCGSLYYGGPGYGAYRRSPGIAGKRFPTLEPMDPDPSAGGDVRLLMGSRDRKAHPWVMDLTNVTLVKTGSIGLKVARILDGQADVFAHLSRKLKIWDTAGPAAIALGAGLEVGTLEKGVLTFPLPAVIHDTSIVMGRRGALSWCHNYLSQGKQSFIESGKSNNGN
jgi:3'(2'), 5'-bisphosphate nucleotidase